VCGLLQDVHCERGIKGSGEGMCVVYCRTCIVREELKIVGRECVWSIAGRAL